MKKLLAIVLLLSLLIPGIASAAELHHTYNHGITCDLVWGSATNGSRSPQMGYGFIKAQPQGVPSPIIVLPGMRFIAPGESYYLSWTPPDGFVGTVRVWVTFFSFPPGYEANGNLECHEYSAKLAIKNNCKRWQLRAIIKDYGKRIGMEYLATGAWVEPYIQETADRGVDYDPSYKITFPDGSTTILGTPEQILEKEKCIEAFICEDETALNYGEEGECLYAVPTPEPEVEIILPEPLFPMQLFEKYGPPTGYLPYCMIMAEGAVAVEIQQSLCGWVADNHTCGGMVLDDDTWKCDSYGYYRQPLPVLLCLRQGNTLEKCRRLAGLSN